MRRVFAALSAAVMLLSVGCGGGIVKGYTARAARDRHASAQNNCPPKGVKTEVVRELPAPEGKDYVAIVRATGCGTSKTYKCWSNTGLASYECEDAAE